MSRKTNPEKKARKAAARVQWLAEVGAKHAAWNDLLARMEAKIEARKRLAARNSALLSPEQLADLKSR